ncbi:MAG: prephenate dehydrogenase [Eubacteriales bacterium]|jgi:prephenate dehydrogenase
METQSKTEKIIGIAGLGLIGGSMAKAIRRSTACQVVGFDLSLPVLQNALRDNAIHRIGTEDSMKQLDVLLLALYPQAILDFTRQHMPQLKPGTIVVDLCGIKEYVCSPLDELARQYGCIYIGGHPMAGREFSGYAYSLPSLFEGGSMILTPMESSTPQAVEEMTQLFYQLGFARVVTTTPQNHDRMIAFTSQLAHVVSSAYIKSPEAALHQGYSAGSYKDLTRVARLNEDMWTDLFLKNSGPLTHELDGLIQRLTQYRNAIAGQDAETLRQLLREGRERKEAIG